jgi:hypothetical protein
MRVLIRSIPAAFGAVLALTAIMPAATLIVSLSIYYDRKRAIY